MNHSEEALRANLTERTFRSAGVKEKGESIFRAMFDALPIAIYTTDGEGHITSFNRACVQLTGRVPEMGSSDWCDLLRNSGPSDSRAADQSALASGDGLADASGVGLEVIVDRPDGTRVWCTPYRTVLRTEAGEAIGTIHMLVDITERKQVEVSMAHQRRLYESVLSTTPDLAYIFDLDHRFIYVNEGLLKMWGKTWDEAIGKNCLELGYEPWHADMHSREIEQVIATQQPIRGIVPFTGTFGRRLYDYIMTPVFDTTGRIQAVAGTTRDVTEIKRTEVALRESEEQLAIELAGMTRLHDLTMRLTVQSDLEQVMRDVMEAAGELLGADHGTAQLLATDGQSLQLVAVKGFDGDFADRFRIVTKEGISTCAAAFAGCERIVVTDFRHCPEFAQFAQLVAPMGITSALSSPVQAGDGSLLGVFSIYWLEPHEPSQHQLRLLDLYLHVAARQIERQKADKILREADRRKDEFLATLAHELRNPLAPIRSGLELMRIAKNNPETLDEIHQTMVRQTEQLVRLIDDLMDVSRITRGKLKLQRQPIALRDVVNAAIETTRPYITEKGHQLVVQLPEEAMLIDVDPHRLTQILSNLLQNAAKYSPEPGQIRLVSQADGADVVLSVKDQGGGIPADQLDEVFEMFAQIGRSAQSGYTGLGIGLTLAKSFVEMHGGTIVAKSDGVGLGAEFVVRLPNCRVGSHGDNLATELDDGPRSPAKQRVLIVDDNRDAARMLSLTLQMLGNEMKVAHDGVEAIEVAVTFRPHIVLLDLGMPRMDGYETAKRIRTLPWGSQTMLVALTGWGQEEDRRRTKAAGFDHHLVKPADIDSLKMILESHRIASLSPSNLGRMV